MTNVIKTTVAAAAMAAAFSAQAIAQDAAELPAAQPTVTLANLYAAMDSNQNRTFQLVMNTTEARMETKIAKIENPFFDEEFNSNETAFVFAGF